MEMMIVLDLVTSSLSGFVEVAVLVEDTTYVTCHINLLFPSLHKLVVHQLHVVWSFPVFFLQATKTIVTKELILVLYYHTYILYLLNNIYIYIEKDILF